MFQELREEGRDTTRGVREGRGVDRPAAGCRMLEELGLGVILARRWGCVCVGGGCVVYGAGPDYNAAVSRFGNRSSLPVRMEL